MTAVAVARRADFSEVPVVDIAPLRAHDPAATRRIAAEIRAAAELVGFFYITGHGVDEGLLERTLAASRQFFALPEAERLALKVNRWHRGFVPAGQTVLVDGLKPDLKESFNFSIELAPDDPDIIAGRPLAGPNQWPALPGWRDTVQAYYAAIVEVGNHVLRGLALALDLPEDHFTTLFRRHIARARLLHYPPQPGPLTGEQFGAARHADYGCITILWQDPLGGLEVQNHAGDWIAAPFLPGSFVVNLGDLMQRWTNDRFVSAKHRVINRSGRERYSIPVFYDPAFDTVIECLPTCQGPGNPPRHPATSCGEWITGKYDKNYAYRKGAA
jgi:isopenicillin N synthase-like dioxygenase